MTTTRSHLERGLFLTLEGPEGAGKTTQAARLRDALEGADMPVTLLREPGGTALGEAIRGLLLATGRSGSPITPRADALLFNAARAQLVVEQINPALADGRTVICSRFLDSTLAYQGAGMGLPLDELRSLGRLATGGLRPDLTLLLDLAVEAGLARKGDEQTRFEADFDVAFHRRVRAGFLALAAAEPERIAIVDAAAAPDDVFDAIKAALATRLGIRIDEAAAASGSPGRPRVSAGTEPNALPVRIHR